MSILIIISILLKVVALWIWCKVMAVFSAALLRKAMRNPTAKQKKQLADLVKEAESHQAEAENDPICNAIANDRGSIIRKKAQDIYDAAKARGYQRIGEVGMLELFWEMGAKLSLRDVRDMIADADKRAKP